MVGDAMAQNFATKLYTSKEWITLRRNLIIERGPICENCGKVMIDTSKLIGHHKEKLTPQNIHDVNITLNPKNIELICHLCHNQEPGHFLGSKQHTIYLVYGAPCSGKTTLVNQMVKRGDMIMDMDKIFECISGMPLYDKPDNLKYNVFVLRDKIIDMAKTRYGKWYDMYIMGGYPNKQERESLARSLGAELLYCKCTYKECVQRAVESTKGVEWIRYIDKWFSEYIE